RAGPRRHRLARPVRLGPPRLPRRRGEDRPHVPRHRRGPVLGAGRPGPPPGRRRHRAARPGLGDDQLRWREDLRRGGGAGHRRAPGRPRRGRRRPAQRALGPGGRRPRPAGGGEDGDRRGDRRARQRPHRPLQAAQGRALPGRDRPQPGGQGRLPLGPRPGAAGRGLRPDAPGPRPEPGSRSDPVAVRAAPPWPPPGLAGQECSAAALRRLAATAVTRPPRTSRPRPSLASGSEVSSPVRGRAPDESPPASPAPPSPSAWTTVIVAESTRAEPSGAWPAAVMVCWPSAVSIGIVACRGKTPGSSATAVPRVTGSDSMVTVAVLPAAKVRPSMVMVWPGVGVVSLIVRLLTAGGYCCAAAGAASSTTASAAHASTRFTMGPPDFPPRGKGPPDLPPEG